MTKILAFRKKNELESNLRSKIIEEVGKNENCLVNDIYKLAKKYFSNNISERNIIIFTDNCLMELEKEFYIKNYIEYEKRKVKLIKPYIPEELYPNKEIRIVRKNENPEYQTNNLDDTLFKLSQEQIEFVINNPYAQVILALLQSSKEIEKTGDYSKLCETTNFILGYIDEINMEDTVEKLIILDLVESYRKGNEILLTLPLEIHQEFPKGDELYKLLVDYSENVASR